jgi:hypothetical protein
MASSRQLRTIFAPILAANPDLVLYRRWLLRPPVGTAIVGIFIDSTRSASMSRMDLSVMPLSRFLAPGSLGFNRGFGIELVIGAPPPGEWRPGAPREPPRFHIDMFAPDFQDHLVRNFDAKARPFFDGTRDFDGILAWLRQCREPSLRRTPPEIIDGWIAAMQGDFATAARELQQLRDRTSNLGHSYQNSPTVRLEDTLIALFHTGDPHRIAAFLHDLERQTVAYEKMERFWHPRPFPFEAT